MAKTQTTQKAQRAGIMQSLAKAATKSTPAPVRQPAKAAATASSNSAASAPAVAVARPTFDWSTVPAPEVVVYHRAVAKTDVEGTTPEAIKTAVKNAFALTEAKGENVWMSLVLASEDMAAEWVRLAKRYATFAGYTMRGGVDKAEAKRVAFAVKPKETRTRKAA